MMVHTISYKEREDDSWYVEFLELINSYILSVIDKKLKEEEIQVDNIEDYCLKNLKFFKVQESGYPLKYILKIYTKNPIKLWLVISVTMTLEEDFTYNVIIEY